MRGILKKCCHGNFKNTVTQIPPPVQYGLWREARRDVDVFGLSRRPAVKAATFACEGVFPAGEQATVAACFRPETEGLLSDFRRPHDDFFYRSADFVEKYQLHSCRLDCSGKQNRVWS